MMESHVSEVYNATSRVEKYKNFQNGSAKSDCVYQYRHWIDGKQRTDETVTHISIIHVITSTWTKAQNK